tara:strand:- start:58899 stop:60053 length:1155 start_codon:yes stop_codon:yes gene_type:complete
VHDLSTVVFAGGGTGGHLYPAMAMAEEMVTQRSGTRPVFIGASKGIESRILPDTGLEYDLLPVRGWKRGSVWVNLGVPYALLKSILTAVKLHKEYRSDLVVVTGGYSSAPAGLAAVMLGIPLVLQEQNAYPGVTTRILSLWAKQIHLSFHEAIKKLPVVARDRVLISGCPIQPPPKVRLNREEMLKTFGLDLDRKVLLVTGGSQGSIDLNELIWKGLRIDGARKRNFFSNWQILWVTGIKNYEAVDSRVEGLGRSSNVRVVPYVNNMAKALTVTDLAISRAGAMTTSEFLAWGIPSILVPLPTAAANHQELNALAIQELGAGLCRTQKDLTSSQLWKEVLQLTEDDEILAKMADRAVENSRPEATSNVVSSILDLLSKPTKSWS